MKYTNYSDQFQFQLLFSKKYSIPIPILGLKIISIPIPVELELITSIPNSTWNWTPFVYAHACLGINKYCLN